MAVEIYMVRVGRALWPADQASEEGLESVKEEKQVRVKITTPRSLQQHKLYFAVLNLVYKYLPEPKFWSHVEFMRAALLIRIGHFDQVKLPDGSIKEIPKSIDMTTLDQSQFQPIFDKTMDVIAKEIIPIADPGLEEEFYRFLKEPGPDAIEQYYKNGKQKS